MSILIAGAGIIGLTVSRELLKRGFEDIIILEKEACSGVHASGRNSGVLHAGVYYSPGSLKAKYCVTGNRLLSEYCLEKGLPYRKSGKVIVTKNEGETETLLQLKKRAEKAGAKVKIIDERELKEIEPYARTIEKALYVPDTAVVEPKSVLKALEKDILSTKKAKIYFNTPLIGVKGKGRAILPSGEVEFKVLINCAGAWSDKIAHSMGVGLDYTLIPFRGHYSVIKREKSHLVRSNIYPVPDLNYPFLGVHFTKSIDGRVFIGPTATPAFGREHYFGLKGVGTESIKMLYLDSLLFLKNRSFRNIAFKEIRRLVSDKLYLEGKKLVPSIKRGDIMPSDKRGIRAQLINRKTLELEDDFILMKGENSLHVLNAISPAFTTSMAFARLICDMVQEIYK